jgi:hypothetical protein
MDEFQALTWTAKKHSVLSNDLTGSDHLDADLGIRAPTNHPPPCIDGDAVQVVTPGLGDNRRHP